MWKGLLVFKEDVVVNVEVVVAVVVVYVEGVCWFKEAVVVVNVEVVVAVVVVYVEGVVAGASVVTASELPLKLEKS